jgi:hypothetical protein
VLKDWVLMRESFFLAMEDDGVDRLSVEECTHFVSVSIVTPTKPVDFWDFP